MTWGAWEEAKCAYISREKKIHRESDFYLPEQFKQKWILEKLEKQMLKEAFLL